MDKNLFPEISDDEREKLFTTIEDISRNSMIRTEVMCKRREGMTVEQACQAVGEEANLAPEYVRKLYYKRGVYGSTQ